MTCEIERIDFLKDDYTYEFILITVINVSYKSWIRLSRVQNFHYFIFNNNNLPVYCFM